MSQCELTFGRHELHLICKKFAAEIFNVTVSEKWPFLFIIDKRNAINNSLLYFFLSFFICVRLQLSGDSYTDRRGSLYDGRSLIRTQSLPFGDDTFRGHHMRDQKKERGSVSGPLKAI